jgi:small subunit ribosomal protein S19
MSRAKWKNLFLNNFIINKSKVEKMKTIKIWNRNVAIPYYLEGKSVYIHNGKHFIKTYISRDKIGFKFGEFAYTKKHTKKIDKKKK